jgi:hypothetical protein
MNDSPLMPWENARNPKRPVSRSWKLALLREVAEMVWRSAGDRAGGFMD